MDSREMTMLVFGEYRSGKSELVKKLIDPTKMFSQKYDQTFGAEHFKIESKKYNLHIWDISGDEKYDNLLSCYMRFDANVALICIDLFTPLSKRSVRESVASWLCKLRQHNSGVPVIIVGLGSDRADSGTLAEFEALAAQNANCQQPSGTGMDNNIYGFCVTSAKTTDGIRKLKNMTIRLMQHERLEDKLLTHEEEHEHDAMAAALSMAGCTANLSLLYTELLNLQRALDHIPDRTTVRRIGAEAETLVIALQNQNENHMAAIQAFEHNCRIVLHGKHPWKRKALKLVASVAIAATVAVITAVLGGFAGLALGAWTGPGAFVAALTSGFGLALVVITSLMGAAGGGLALFGLFRKRKEDLALDEACNSLRVRAAGIATT